MKPYEPPTSHYRLVKVSEADLAMHWPSIHNSSSGNRMVGSLFWENAEPKHAYHFLKRQCFPEQNM